MKYSVVDLNFRDRRFDTAEAAWAYALWRAEHQLGVSAVVYERRGRRDIPVGYALREMGGHMQTVTLTQEQQRAW